MSSPIASLASLFLGLAFLLCGNGLQTTLVPLRAGIEGFSAIQIGLLGSGYYSGFVLGCLAAPYLIRRAGHIRAFAALVSAASAIALVHPVVIDPVAWVAARAITGFSLAGLYLIVESWLNDRASNENRGFLMSAYIIVSFVTITIGQMLVLTSDVREFTLFVYASILVSVAAIPVVLTTSEQPTPIALVQFRPLRLYRIAPVGIVGTFMIGIANGAFWSLGTYYATSRGLDVNGAAIFMSIAVIGGAAMQWPIGRLSDSFDRRLVLAGGMLLAALVCLVLALVPLGRSAFLIMGFVFGMTNLTAYSVAAAHAYDRADKSSYVEMAAGVLLANGVGSIVGPILASTFVDAFGPAWLFYFIAATQFLLVAFVMLRTRLRPSQTPAEKEGFNVYATAPVGGYIAPDIVPPADAAKSSGNPPAEGETRPAS